MDTSGQLYATAALPLQTRPIIPLDPRASLGVVAKRNILSLQGIKPQ
jgi:hypothetical protein